MATAIPERSTEGDFHEQQADENLAQVIADSVPQLQAQVQQLALHLQNPNLPLQVRQQTELQHSQLQMQLQHAQTIALALAAANAGAGTANIGANVHAYQQAGEVLSGGVGLGMPGVNMGMGMGTAWGGPFNAQQSQQGDGAYQRLPVNNRRRNLKRDRPSG
jgi:protein MPE1